MEQFIRFKTYPGIEFVQLRGIVAAKKKMAEGVLVLSGYSDMFGGVYRLNEVKDKEALSTIPKQAWISNYSNPCKLKFFAQIS